MWTVLLQSHTRNTQSQAKGETPCQRLNGSMAITSTTLVTTNGKASAKLTCNTGHCVYGREFKKEPQLHHCQGRVLQVVNRLGVTAVVSRCLPVRELTVSALPHRAGFPQHASTLFKKYSGTERWNGVAFVHGSAFDPTLNLPFATLDGTNKPTPVFALTSGALIRRFLRTEMTRSKASL